MRVIADYETGEILETLDEDKSYVQIDVGDKIIKQNTITYLKGTVDFTNKMDFVKVNTEAIRELNKYADEIVLLFSKIQYQTGLLCHRNGKLVTSKKLAGVLKKSNRTGANVIKELIDLEVINKHRLGRSYYYTFNPWIAHKGKRITRELYDEYCTSKWAGMSYKKSETDWSDW